jgi:hypothetical protein
MSPLCPNLPLYNPQFDVVPLAVPNVLATALVNGIGIAGTLVGWEVGTGLDIECVTVGRP